MRTCAYLTSGRSRPFSQPSFTEARIVVVAGPVEPRCTGCDLATSKLCSRLRRPQTLGESPLAATLRCSEGWTEDKWRQKLEKAPCSPEFESYS